jgi:hypothetical protein|tara:strand:- start:604 stop:804 length:201 start_codon:yes stop_codon:yes gene_type:complete
MKPNRKLIELEESLMEDFVQDIGGSQDPVDQFKAIERYAKFVEARSSRIRAENFQSLNTWSQTPDA